MHATATERRKGRQLMLLLCSDPAPALLVLVVKLDLETGREG